jgi:hypothetical protein
VLDEFSPSTEPALSDVTHVVRAKKAPAGAVIREGFLPPYDAIAWMWGKGWEPTTTAYRRIDGASRPGVLIFPCMMSLVKLKSLVR